MGIDYEIVTHDTSRRKVTVKKIFFLIHLTDKLLFFEIIMDEYKCPECNKPHGLYWCQQCNGKRFQQDFHKWSSENKFIDKFILETQLNTKKTDLVLEWIHTL